MDRTEIAALVITCVLIVMDYLTGLAKSVVNKDIDSTKMRDGLWHKAAYVAVIVLAEIIEHGQEAVDLGFAVPLIVPTCVYIVLTETASILENLSQINPELADSPVMQLFRSTKDAAENGAKSGNHYNGRNGYSVTHITLHIMVGYLAGTDSTFANSASQASAHYGIGADGTIHQYVSERDGSYSDANYASNNSCISIEHEGGMAQGAVCTQACIDASARLCADIARRYGWDHLWHDGTRGNIWLHREIPGTDHAGCPDLVPNGLPYQQVIDKANAILKGENMSVAEVTEGLYQAKGNDGRNIFDSVIQTKNELKDRAADALYTAKGNDGRNLFDGVIQARWDIAELKTMLTAQTAAIEALSQAMGADPDQIAEAVKHAVADKLDSLHITIKAED